MKTPSTFTLTLIVILMLSGLAFAVIQKSECDCTCKGKTLSVTGFAQKKLLADVTEDADAACRTQCAKTCGGSAGLSGDGKKCTADCGTFCSDGTNYNDAAGAGAYVGECKNSCASTCELKGLINSTVDAIYAVAGVIGAVMLIIHGIRFASADDVRVRDAAKSGMWHVIMALVVIAIAGAAVRLFTGFVNV